MDYFKAGPDFELLPSDVAVPKSFRFKSASENAGGALPQGHVIVSATATATSPDGQPANDLINGDPDTSGEIVTVRLNYPSAGKGRYTLNIVVHTDQGTSKTFRYDRIVAEE